MARLHAVLRMQKRKTSLLNSCPCADRSPIARLSSTARPTHPIHLSAAPSLFNLPAFIPLLHPVVVIRPQGSFIMLRQLAAATVRRAPIATRVPPAAAMSHARFLAAQPAQVRLARRNPLPVLRCCQRCVTHASLIPLPSDDMPLTPALSVRDAPQCSSSRRLLVPT